MAKRKLSQGNQIIMFWPTFVKITILFLINHNFSNSFIISLQQLLHLKEKKEMDEQFKKAQKPWSKLLLNVNKTKADYHAACKAEKTAVNIERNAGGDSLLSQDHVSLMKGLKKEL